MRAALAAHAPRDYPAGFLTAPIPKPAQVAMLDDGAVLMQYTRASSATLAFFRAITVANSSVAAAPNSSLDQPIVLTAWLYSMRCTSLDKTAIRNFVATHTGKAPAH